MAEKKETIEEMLARFEEEDRRFEEIQHDPRYDGDSPSLTKEEELAFYRERAIRTKEDILRVVDGLKELFTEESKLKEIPLNSMLPLLEQFAAEIKDLLIMDIHEDWWQYRVFIRETDINLSLDHTKIYYDRGDTIWDMNKPIMGEDQSFVLHSTKARLLSPEEFGKLHGVSDGTVRQWIRRGKLRSASKFGKEWRIPEIIRVASGEHYQSGSYSWHTELPDVPEGFEYLNDYDMVSISSVKGEKGKWYISFGSWEKDVEKRHETVDSKEKERLELYLIAEPLVECDNNYYGDFSDKTLPEIKWIKEKAAEGESRGGDTDGDGDKN